MYDSKNVYKYVPNLFQNKARGNFTCPLLSYEQDDYLKEMCQRQIPKFSTHCDRIKNL